MPPSTIKKKILIICLTDTNYDARVARQLDFLKDEYHITFLGYGTHLSSGIEFIEIPKTALSVKDKLILASLLLSKSFNEAYWYQYPFKEHLNEVQKRNFDLILANDVESLPLAFYLSNGKRIKILFDAHEYSPRQFEDRLYWRVFFQKYTIHLCKTFIPKVDGMFTVCDGLAKEYQKEFHVLPQVFTNAPEYHEIKPTPTEPEHIKLIHHGIFNLSRKMENMFEMMEYLDERFTLDLMVKTTPSSSKKTLAHLESLKKEALNSGRIKFVPPVTSKEIVSVINKYDVGIFILEPINFNYKHALPNKLFDFIQARLAIGISPSLEMKKIVEQYQLGIVAEDFTPKSLAIKLNSLQMNDITRFKHNSHLAASTLSANENKRLLINTIETVLAI